MTSLGDVANCRHLVCDKITCTQEISSAHKEFGPELNKGAAHHHGSILYFKWSAVHQVDQIATSENSASVTYSTSAAHNLAVNDTIHIQTLPIPPSGTPLTAVNGIPVAQLQGIKTVVSVPTNSTFTISATTNASATGTNLLVVPRVRVDYYKSIDMSASSATSFTHSTTTPTNPTNDNTIETFVS